MLATCVKYKILFTCFIFLLQPIQGWEYDTKKYREAITKKELCKVDLVSLWGENPAYDKLPIEKMRKEYHEYCPKSKSHNIVSCPEKIIKRKNDIRVQWINDYFKKNGKKGRGKKNEMKSPEKIIKRKNDITVQWINDYFKNLVKKSKEKTTKKGKKRRRENKVKVHKE